MLCLYDSTSFSSIEKTGDIRVGICYNSTYRARVVELVDTLALGASAFGREGSSPFARTKSKSRSAGLLFDLGDICSHT